MNRAAPKRTSKDPLIDQVRRTRQKLLRKYGGLRGWAKHLQEMESKRKARRSESTGTR